LYVFKTISNGIGGTPMVGFKSDLTEEQRWKLVAFILSPVGAKESTAERPAESSPLPAGSRGGASMPLGDAVGGRELFYDLANQRSCHGCHAIHGVGGRVGPDLEGAAAKSDAELLAAILKPRRVTDSKYATVTIMLADGDKIVGVQKEEAGEVVRVYDTTTLPAVLRTLRKSEIAKSERSEQSVMPGDYGSIYTEKQLADIVAFIKSVAAKSDR
jgi:putative heme-binding domain-containing protein